jgi:hypothetical protein
MANWIAAIAAVVAGVLNPRRDAVRFAGITSPLVETSCVHAKSLAQVSYSSLFRIGKNSIRDRPGLRGAD